MLVVGLLLSFALLTRPTASKPSSFTYSAFTQAVQADQVATAAIDVNGHVSGKLKKGGRYTSQIPIALRDDQLAPTLAQHGVQITGGPQTSVFSVILGLLPFVLFFGVFLWLGRRTGRVVLEIQMPLQEGLDTIAALHLVSPRPRIVVCSFHRDAATIQGALDRGADAYLTKPVNSADFGAALGPLPAERIFRHRPSNERPVSPPPPVAVAVRPGGLEPPGHRSESDGPIS